MKDLRDLANIVEEGQKSTIDHDKTLDGIWDTFKKIDGKTVPDAVQQLSPDTIRWKHKNRRSTAVNKQKEKLRVDNDMDDGDITSKNSND